MNPKTQPKTPNRPVAAGAPATQKLKAERVELKLAQLTDWSPTEKRTSLVRIFDLGSAHQAAAFAGFLAGLLSQRRGHVGISQQKVSILLDGVPGQGITDAELVLARRIGRLVESMKRGWEGR